MSMLAWLTHDTNDNVVQRRGGTDLSAQDAERVDALVARLDELGHRFADNVGRATAGAALHLTNEDELRGLSPGNRRRARLRAEAQGVTGVLLTVDEPSYETAMRELDDRALRKRLFEARFTRASEKGPGAGRFDNTSVFREMLERRHELARLLGFRDYAELSLRHHVFDDPDDAEAYLLTVHRDTRGKAQSELDQLWAFAKEKGVPRGFSNWDLPYYSSWLTREEEGCDATAAQVYFSLPSVLEGLRAWSTRLLGIQIGPPHDSDPAAPLHLTVADEGGSSLGEMELSVFAGPGELRERQVTPSPRGRRPGQLCVRLGLEASAVGEVPKLTLEQLQELLGAVAGGLVQLRMHATGDQVANPAAHQHDALAAIVAGRYFAQLCGHFECVVDFARHHETGERLPRELFERLERARTRHSHLEASQQLELALFDLRVHRDFVPESRDTLLRDQILDTFMQVRREQSVLPLPYWTRVANSCLPLFAGDEAARVWQRTWTGRVAALLFARARDAKFEKTCLDGIRAVLTEPSGVGVVQRVSQALGRPLDPRLVR